MVALGDVLQAGRRGLCIFQPSALGARGWRYEAFLMGGEIGGDLWLGLYPPPFRNGRNGSLKKEPGSFCGFVATVWPFEVLQSEKRKQPQLRASPGSGPLYVIGSVEGVCTSVCVCVWRIVMFGE